MTHLIRGWRRKSGVVTLLVVLLLMCGWVRSQGICDWVSMRADERTMYTFSSLDNGISWYRHFDPPPVEGPPIWWGSSGLSGMEILDWSGHGSLYDPDPRIALAPYWMIVSPLTMFAAFLLFPRCAVQSSGESQSRNPLLRDESD